MLISPPLVLDSDVISAFALVNRLDILESLYREQMLVLDQVQIEVSKYYKVGALLSNVINRGAFQLGYLDPLGKDGWEFANLIDKGCFGQGEAAIMAYVRFRGGTVGSSNIRDVLRYCEVHGLPLLATRPIMFDAYQRRIIAKGEACQIWTDMRRKNIRLPDESFADVVRHFTLGDVKKHSIQRY